MVQKYTEARKEGNRRWDAANLDRMSIALPKGEKDKIKAYASSHGFKSVNEFIALAVSEAIDTRLAKDGNGDVIYLPVGE